MSILPRQSYYRWRPLNGHVPPEHDGVRDDRRGFGQVDAGWYSHSVDLRRRGVQAAWDLNPLDPVLNDLEKWVRRLCQRLPARHDVQAYFDVIGRDDRGALCQWRASGFTLLNRPNFRDVVQQMIEDALQDPSSVMVIVDSIRMFVLITPRPAEVELVGDDVLDLLHREITRTPRKAAAAPRTVCDLSTPK